MAADEAAGSADQYMSIAYSHLLKLLKVSVDM
jgi:hypothetical protein